MKKDEIYGQHLILRISEVSNFEALNSESAISVFLKKLVKRIKMTVLAGPLTAREEGIPEKVGCSGVVILFESHIAIHTYSERREAFIDVFSCEDYDAKDVHAVVEEFFGTYKVVEETLMDRGVHWDNDIKKETNRWIGMK